MTKTSASILIVDDDEAIRGLLSACLDPAYWCATAASAEEAASLLEPGSFDLVLSDITMPGASGLDFCRYAQKTCPRTVVVMISAMIDIQYAIEAMRDGALDSITKLSELTRGKISVDRALPQPRASA